MADYVDYVETTLLRHGTADPLTIAAERGIFISYQELPTNFRAIVFGIPELIIVNAVIQPPRQLAAIAHCLGHYIMHGVIRPRIEEDIYWRMEPDRIADRFATLLLSYYYHIKPDNYIALMDKPCLPAALFNQAILSMAN